MTIQTTRLRNKPNPFTSCLFRGGWYLQLFLVCAISLLDESVVAEPLLAPPFEIHRLQNPDALEVRWHDEAIKLLATYTLVAPERMVVEVVLPESFDAGIAQSHAAEDIKAELRRTAQKSVLEIVAPAEWVLCANVSEMNLHSNTPVLRCERQPEVEFGDTPPAELKKELRSIHRSQEHAAAALQEKLVAIESRTYKTPLNSAQVPGNHTGNIHIPYLAIILFMSIVIAYQAWVLTGARRFRLRTPAIKRAPGGIPRKKLQSYPDSGSKGLSLGDCYQILGAQEDWTDVNLQEHYRALVRRYHPDLQPEGSRAPAHQRFKKLQQAYERIRVARELDK